ncbi:hypothetical protein BBMA_4755 [Burkholderia pseudomallei MSHR1079]|nr:hypothetical protein BBMA_4755 [Burkholderia pseudomallei MSHR1079]
MRKSHGRGVCRGTRETSGPTRVTRRTRTPLGRRLDPRGDRVRFGCRATNDRAARLESDGRRASCASCVPHFAMHVRPVRRRCPFETGCARNAEHEACGDSRCTRRSRSVPPNRQDPTVHRSAHRFEISSRPMHGEMPRCGLETFASSCRFGIDYTDVTRRQSEQLSPAGAHGARHDIRFVARSIRRSLDEVLDEVLVEARDVVRDSDDDSDDDSDSDGDGGGGGNSHHDSDSESWHRIRACQPARHAVDQRLRARHSTRAVAQFRSRLAAAAGDRSTGRPAARRMHASAHRRIDACVSERHLIAGSSITGSSAKPASHPNAHEGKRDDRAHLNGPCTAKSP